MCIRDRAQFVRDPKDPPGTYREKCNAYGWGFARGVNKAVREQEEQHQEWGLVMVVPQAGDNISDIEAPSRTLQ